MARRVVSVSDHTGDMVELYETSDTLVLITTRKFDAARTTVHLPLPEARLLLSELGKWVHRAGMPDGEA